MPLYNKAASIERTLCSIQAQKMSGFEVIVVNDGSTDESVARVEAFLRETRDRRFRLIHQRNEGPGSARNRGVEAATAEWVAFLDGDDEWQPTYLERCLGLLAEHPEANAISTAWFDEPGRISFVPRMQAVNVSTGLHITRPDTNTKQLAMVLVFMSPCSTVARRQRVLEFGGFREGGCKFGEDVHLWIQFLMSDPVYVLLEEQAIFHRHLAGLSGNYKGARPVEPFLEDPSSIRESCPGPKREKLNELLAVRAFKTALMLAYWGHWREAAALRRKFSVPTERQLPLHWISMLAASPLGAAAGAVARKLKRS